jgi:hypothetical protein
MSPWKLRHYIFGTHFVLVPYGCNYNVCAIRWTPNGQPYVKIYSAMIWLLDGSQNWRALTFDKAAWLARHLPAAAQHIDIITRSAA